MTCPLRAAYFAQAEAEHRHVTRLRVADRFQVDPAEARGREAHAITEQHRQHVHQDLVDEPSPQALTAGIHIAHAGCDPERVTNSSAWSRCGGGSVPEQDLGEFLGL